MSSQNSLPCATEEQEQAAVFQWAALMENQLPELELLHHIPNGGLRSKTEAVRFKRTGVKAGIPDICLPVARGAWHGLYIELKRKDGGKLSSAQALMMSKLISQNYFAVCCHGAEDACAVIYEYLTGKNLEVDEL